MNHGPFRALCVLYVSPYTREVERQPVHWAKHNWAVVGSGQVECQAVVLLGSRTTGSACICAMAAPQRANKRTALPCEPRVQRS